MADGRCLLFAHELGQATADPEASSAWLGGSALRSLATNGVPTAFTQMDGGDWIRLELRRLMELQTFTMPPNAGDKV